jgi:N-methylhydantoinase A
VPPASGVLSALGFLLADIKNVFPLTRVGLIGTLDVDAYNRDLERLIAQAAEWLEWESVPPEDREIACAVDLRYRGQAYELPIAVGPRLDAAAWQDAAARFHAEHKRRYGFDEPFAGIEVVTLRVTAIGHLPKLAMRPQSEGEPDPSRAQIDERPVYFDNAYHDTRVYDRALLRPGNRLAGPAIIVQPDCTTVLHPGQSLRVDGFGNLIVSL